MESNCLINRLIFLWFINQLYKQTIIFDTIYISFIFEFIMANNKEDSEKDLSEQEYSDSESYESDDSS